jgi:hypothetical protein
LRRGAPLGPGLGLRDRDLVGPWGPSGESSSELTSELSSEALASRCSEGSRIYSQRGERRRGCYGEHGVKESHMSGMITAS